MERLTTDKPVSEMNMVELAHNCCYIKDGNARYRDFENDINAKDFVWELTVAHKGDTSCLPSNEDSFDMQMVDNLQYSSENIEGFIALFYRNLWAMAELRERLKSYEDLEITAEQVRELDRICTQTMQELGKYQKLEQRLDNIFHGQLKFEKAVEEIEHTLVNPNSPHPVNAIILTHEESAEWEEYRKLKEQGLILKTCCRVGDELYHIIEDRIADPPIYISVHKIQDVSAKAIYAADHWWLFEELREMNAFLNREEAEQTLKEMENANGQREQY